MHVATPEQAADAYLRRVLTAATLEFKHEPVHDVTSMLRKGEALSRFISSTHGFAAQAMLPQREHSVSSLA